MSLFESILVLLLVAIVLLRVSRSAHVPYPTMLAVAGAGVAALPWAPSIAMEPRLALALFIAPALLDAAYDLPPRELRRAWLPLVALAIFAVLVTTAVVAWVGWAFAGLPLAAAIALGAIVAPPDAAAAGAVLRGFDLPRRTVSILHGESLLNDAVSLLVFSAAVAAAGGGHSPVQLIPRLVLAAPGGVVLGLVLAKIFLALSPQVAGTLSSTVLQFVSTFGTWVIAERLHLSPILAVVAYAMLLARHGPYRQSARDRVHSYSVWEAAVFVLNVLAFLLMGLQARTVIAHLRAEELRDAIGFSAILLVVVIVVRVGWVVGCGALMRALRADRETVPSVREDLLVSWCGMRGLVTLATAFALPADFPKRDLIVLAAFTVVLGTLVVNGLTIAPLLRLLRMEPDRSLETEVSRARTAMLDAALATLREQVGSAAETLRAELRAAREVARDREAPQASTPQSDLRMNAIAAERKVLRVLRLQGKISDDAYHRLEEELDWAELDAAPRGHFEIEEV